jgi:hypothetical protein
MTGPRAAVSEAVGDSLPPLSPRLTAVLRAGLDVFENEPEIHPGLKASRNVVSGLYDIVKRLIRASHQQVVGPRSDVRRDDLGSGDVRLDAKSSTHDVPARKAARASWTLSLPPLSPRLTAVLRAGLDVFENEPEIHPGLMTGPRAAVSEAVGDAQVRQEERKEYRSTCWSRSG